MNLPGTPLRVTDSSDLTIFLQDVCEPCQHGGYCSVLAFAGMYGGASEWRTVDDKSVCIHHKPFPVIDRSTDPEEVLS